MTRQELLEVAEALFSYRIVLENLLYKQYQPGELTRKTSHLKDLQRSLERLADEADDDKLIKV